MKREWKVRQWRQQQRCWLVVELRIWRLLWEWPGWIGSRISNCVLSCQEKLHLYLFISDRYCSSISRKHSSGPPPAEMTCFADIPGEFTLSIHHYFTSTHFPLWPLQYSQHVLKYIRFRNYIPPRGGTYLTSPPLSSHTSPWVISDKGEDFLGGFPPAPPQRFITVFRNMLPINPEWLLLQQLSSSHTHTYHQRRS